MPWRVFVTMASRDRAITAGMRSARQAVLMSFIAPPRDPVGRRAGWRGGSTRVAEVWDEAPLSVDLECGDSRGMRKAVPGVFHRPRSPDSPGCGRGRAGLR